MILGMFFADLILQFGLGFPLRPPELHVTSSQRRVDPGLGRWLCLLVLFGMSHVPLASADSGTIELSHAKETGWVLDVKGAPLAEVFRTLSERMGVPIVTAPPPEAPLTMRCSGGDVRAIVGCLLGSGASVIYHMGLPGHRDGISSVRILGSTYVRMPVGNANADPSKVAAILEMTRSEDPDARAEGYTRLAQLGTGNETLQRSAFHQGLSDASGDVRAAALLGLHGVDPMGSREEMMNGLKDADGSVRLAAMDIMGEGPGSEAMLRQALNDPDELVRELARMRLGLPEQNRSQQ
jgi:hypothetical protein